MGPRVGAMATSRIFVPTDSTEYISVKVLGTQDGNIINLTSTPVEIGLRSLEAGVAGPVTFYPADWEVVQGIYFARLLIGPEPGGIFLPIETYNIWVKVYATPQLLVRKSPTILEIRPSEAT